MWPNELVFIQFNPNLDRWGIGHAIESLGNIEKLEKN
jgi:hypothetical protein